MFPFGVVIAANTIRKRNDEQEKQKEKAQNPASHIELDIDEENIQIQFSVKRDFDWARAAWALTKACEANGQLENLHKILAEEKLDVVSGNFKGEE